MAEIKPLPIGHGKKKKMIMTKMKKMKKGRGIIDTVKKIGKKIGSTVSGVSDKLKKLGLARKTHSIVSNPLVQTGAARFGPKGVAVQQGIERVTEKLKDLGYGKRRRMKKGRGIVDSVKGLFKKASDVNQKVKSYKPASKAIDFIEKNEAVRKIVPGKVLNTVMRNVLQPLKRRGYGNAFQKMKGIHDLNSNVANLTSKFGPKEFKVANSLLQMARNKK